MSTNKRGKLVCDKCRRIRDPLYYVGNNEICYECRAKGEVINDMAQVKRRAKNRAKAEREG